MKVALHTGALQTANLRTAALDTAAPHPASLPDAGGGEIADRMTARVIRELRGTT